MHMGISQEPFCVDFFREKRPVAIPGASVLCELAQPKCTWAFHKSHFVRKFTGQMATFLCEPAQSKCTWAFHKSIQKPFCVKI